MNKEIFLNEEVVDSLINKEGYVDYIPIKAIGCLPGEIWTTCGRYEKPYLILNKPNNFVVTGLVGFVPMHDNVDGYILAKIINRNGVVERVYFDPNRPTYKRLSHLQACIGRMSDKDLTFVREKVGNAIGLL